jgi:hypothetical protein
MRNYQIKISMSSTFCMMHFEIVEPGHQREEFDGELTDRWIYDSLEQAKYFAIAYLEEQYPDEIDACSMIKPRSIINNIRMCDLWDDFWSVYEEDRKLLNALKDDEYDELTKRIKK